MEHGLTRGLPAIGEAKSIPCPACGVPADQRCVDHKGRVVAYHVERARMARWELMGTHFLDMCAESGT